MIDLHNKKTESVIYNGKRGMDAFCELGDIANDMLYILFFNKYIIDNFKHLDYSNEEAKESLNTNFIDKDILKRLNTNYDIFFNDTPFYGFDMQRNTQHTTVRINKLIAQIECLPLEKIDLKRFKKNEEVINFLNTYIKTIQQDEYFLFLKKTGNYMYKEHGYKLGSYFRNMYYIMNTIDKFSDPKNYKDIFRAQLSRHELAMCLYNSVCDQSSDKMVNYVKEYELFKDIYPDDICLFNGINDSNEIPKTTNRIGSVN